MSRRNRSITYILTILLLFVGGFSPLHPASGSPRDTSDAGQISQDVDDQPTDGELDDPTPTPTIPPPLPTATTEPTVALTPTATDEPTPTPTETPTEVPPEPSIEPTATLPTETAVPSVTPTATSQPPTVTPTPKPSGPGVRSIVSGSGCTQTSTTDVVDVDVAVNFSCEARIGAAFVSYGGTVSAPTAGWQYRVNNTGTWLTAGSNLPTQLVILGRSVPAFTISLRPSASVAPGSSGSVTVSITVSCTFGCGSGVSTYTTTLGATRTQVAPTASDLQLVCSPTSVNTGPGLSQTVSCVYSGRASLGSRQVTLTRVLVPAPAGWTIVGSAGTVAGTTLTVTPNATISYSATAPSSYSFTFTITPSCSAATTNQSMNMTSTFTFGATTGIAGATATGQAARSSQSSLALSVQDSTLNWNLTASFTDATVSGNLTYRIAARGCSGWSVTIAVSPYTYSGSHGGTAIPAANMTLTDAGIPVVISGSGTGVARQNASGSMNSSRKVLSAVVGSGTGTYEQELDFSLTIPGKSRTGTYQSTITLTSAAAP